MRNVLICALMLALAFPSSSYSAEKIAFHTLTTSDGLSSNEITAIFRDSRGFLWVGTREGLNRYDAYRFMQFSMRDGLPGRNILSLSEDPSGRVWVQTDSGVVIYDYSTHAFIPVENALEPYHIGIDAPVGFGISRDHRFFWVHDGIKVASYDAIKRTTVEFSGSGSPILSLAQQQGRLWFLSVDGRLFRADVLSGATEEILCPGEVSAQFLFYMPQLFVDSKEGVWIYTFRNSVIFHYTPAEGWQKIELPWPVQEFNRITRMAEDSSGTIWVTTSHHGVILLNKDGSIDNLVHEPNKLFSLPGNNLVSLFIDDDDVVWIGNFKLGLSSYTPRTQTFLHYYLNGPDDVLSVKETSKGIFIGTDGYGLLRADNYDSVFRPVETGANVINCIMEDGKGDLWLGTWGNGLVRLGQDGYRKAVYTSGNSGLLSNSIFSIKELDGAIYLGLYYGEVQKLDPSTGAFSTLFQENGLMLNDMVVIQGPKLVAATSRGLIEIDPVSGESRRIQSNRSGTFSFEGIGAEVLFVDSMGNLWVGGDNGVLRWDPVTDEVLHMSSADGLQSDTVTSITEDVGGRIWLGTSKGLSSITLENYEPFIHNFSSKDGLGWTEFNSRAMTRLSGGDIVAGTPKGFTAILPKVNFNGPFDDVIHLTGVDYRQGNSLTPGREREGKRIEVVLMENMFPVSLHFSCLDFAGENTISYQYLIKGHGNEWTDMKSNTVEFSVLSPDKYEISVRACNDQLVWSPNVRTVTLVVRPPFYRSRLAMSSYALILLGGAFLFFRQRRKRLMRLADMERMNREAEHQKKLVDMKLTFFSNVSHELRTPLSLIVNPLEEFTKRYPQYADGLLSTARNNAAYLRELIDQLLAFRKIDAGGESMNYTHQNVVTMLKDVFMVYQSFADNRKIRYTFSADPSSIDMDFDRDKLSKVLHNLLTNSFKFTPDGGSIGVSVRSERDGILCLQVSDTGSGIPEGERDKVFDMFYQVPDRNRQAGGSGIGLYLVSQYVKMHSGTVEVGSNEPQGTIFTVRVPLSAATPVIARTDSTPVLKLQDADIEVNQDSVRQNVHSLLLVDDNTEFLDFLSESLSRQYRVLKATDGEKALDILKDEQVDLVISDIMMPNMNGLELCKAIKTDLRTFNIPVLLLTAKIGEEFQLEGLGKGADDYITKPFNMEILKIRIAKLIEGGLKQRRRLAGEADIEPSRMDITPLDLLFVEKAVHIVEENISKEGFSVEELASELNMSRGYLYRKMLKITGKTPLEFIHVIRMKRAQQLLAESQLQVAEVAYKLGYSSPKTFTKHFKNVFGVSPSEYLRSWKKQN